MELWKRAVDVALFAKDNLEEDLYNVSGGVITLSAGVISGEDARGISPTRERVESANKLRYPALESIHARFIDLVQALQHPENGLRVEGNISSHPEFSAKCEKCEKKKATYVFQLQDLIQWLKDNRQFEDEIEVGHFVRLGCLMGYFYPCCFDWNYRTLRSDEDDKVFYGFQGASNWPSWAVIPDDIDYSVHLLSRGMGDSAPELDEYEQKWLRKMKKRLHFQWSFVQKLCHEQHSLLNGCCENDKRIKQWQDFAYWKINRPCNVRNHSTYGTSEQLRGLNRASNNQNTVKVIIENDDNKETKARKAATSCKRIANICNDWAAFDPMVNEDSAFNPWLIESCKSWPKKADECVPSKYEVKRWGVSFDLLMGDQLGQDIFEQHLKKEFSVENLRFYRACMELKLGPLSKVGDLVKEIVKEFVNEDAKQQINIETKSMSVVKKELSKAPTIYTFESAFEHIYNLMKKDSYRRFLSSALYKNAVASAEDPAPPPPPAAKQGIGLPRIWHLAMYAGKDK